MKITVSIDQSEIGAIQAKIEAKTKEIEKKLETALYEAGELVMTACQTEAPVDTGYLRSSIGVNRVTANEVHISPHAHYAGYVEFGTYKMGANPYMKRGVEKSRNQVASYLKSIK